MKSKYLLAAILSVLVLVLVMPNTTYLTGSNSSGDIAAQRPPSNAEFYPTDIPRVSDQVMDVVYSQVGSDSSSEASVGSLGDLEPRSPGTITVKGTLKYWDEWGVYNPVRRIKVYLMDDDTGPDETVASQWSDYSGRFSFTVNNDDGVLQDGRDPYIKIESENPYAKCRPGLLEIYYWNLPKCGDDVPDGFYYDYGTRTLDGSTTGKAVLQVLDAVLTEANWIYSRVTWTRPQLNVYYPSDGPKFHYFDSVVEHIDLPSGDHDHATVYHEYGHAVMYQLYGSSFPSGSGPDPHNPTSESSGGFALVEGWAEFMECAVGNDPDHVQWDYHNMETNDWYNHVDSGNMDGNIVEGSAASILWDIFDPVSAADKDSMSWGFEEIFTVMRYDHPSSMDSFWTKWTTRWPDLYTSKGPLCTIYWHYGIDKDTYAPYSGSISINAGAIYTKSTSVTLTLSCIDGGSGVGYMRFRNSPTATWSNWQAYSTLMYWTLATGDGAKYVYVQFKDWKGYISSTYSDTIILDTVPPAGSMVINYGNPSYTTSRSVTLYLTCYDATSGVDKVRFRNYGNLTWTAWETFSTTRAWTLMSGEGTKRVYCQIMDRAGWASSVLDDTIVLDTSPPTGSIVINSGNPSNTTLWAVTLYLTYNDPISGVDKVRFRNGDEPWSSWETPSLTKSWILIGGTGTKRVYYQIRDKAGWTSTSYYDEIALLSPKVSKIFFNLNPNPATKAFPTRLMGILIDSSPTSHPIGNAQVKVWYTSKVGGSWTYLMTLVTNASGIFGTSITASASTYYHVTYAGDTSHPACSSNALLVVRTLAGIASPASFLFFNFNPNPAHTASKVQLEGVLLNSLGSPIVSAMVKVEYSTDSGATWNYVGTLTTGAYGMFSTTLTSGPITSATLYRVKYGTKASITTYLGVIA